MALKKDELLNHPEIDALQDVEGVDPQKILEQAGIEKPETPPAEPGEPPAEPPVETPKPGEPPAEPPVETPADPGPTPQDAFLKEIFGDRFKTVEEAKKANIPGILDEVETLRGSKAELEGKLAAKPKTNFANDDVALFNEFVKETGIHNYGVFQRVNNTDIANMDPMDALVSQYILEHPTQAGKEPQVRKLFERKYNVDPDQVEEEQLELNKLEMEADGATAKKALQGLKDKLKVPEPSPDVPVKKELTPEEKSTLKTGWTNVGKEVTSVFSKLNIPIKNGKDPLLQYEVSEAEQKEIQDFVTNYAVENQMELNQDNVKMITLMVRNQLVINKLPDIVHSVFEKARTLTEEEVHALYENPSPSRNEDKPPVPPGPPKDEKEKLQDEIFDKEMDRYNQ